MSLKEDIELILHDELPAMENKDILENTIYGRLMETIEQHNILLDEDTGQYKMEIRELKAELEQLKNRKEIWVLSHNNLYLSSINERGECEWTANMAEALQKTSLEEINLLAKRAGVPITVRQIGTIDFEKPITRMGDEAFD